MTPAQRAARAAAVARAAARAWGILARVAFNLARVTFGAMAAALTCEDEEDLP